MDGITFGILYWVTALMPFDLNHLPTEQVTLRPMPEGGRAPETRSWRFVNPGEVVQTTVWMPTGNTMRTVYKVDAAGRILSMAEEHVDGAKSGAEYAYASGQVSRIKRTYQGSPNGEEIYTWSDGKLATASYIDREAKDTAVYTFGWKGDRIDTIHTPASFPQGVVLRYEYPTADSVRMVMYRPSGNYATGYKLKDGHIVSSDGFFNTGFKYASQVGIRPRVPVGIRPSGPTAEGRDWLGRLFASPRESLRK